MAGRSVPTNDCIPREAGSGISSGKLAFLDQTHVNVVLPQEPINIGFRGAHAIHIPLNHTESIAASPVYNPVSGPGPRVGKGISLTRLKRSRMKSLA